MSPTWAQLVAVTAQRSFTSKRSAEQVLRRFFEELAKATWATGRVVVPGLGAFRVRARKARQIVAPTRSYPLPREMTLPAERVVLCRVAKSWRRRV